MQKDKPEKKQQEQQLVNKSPLRREELLTWKAPSRPFKKREREYFTTIAAIILLFAVILLFVKEFLLIAVILSFAFLAYALATVPPSEVEHKITDAGITNTGREYLWAELGEFWFDEKWGQQMLVIQSLYHFPGRFFMMLGDVDRIKIKKLLEEHLPFRKQPVKTWIDNASEWLAKKIPLEKTTQ